jgi:hypothetical protein
MIEETTHLIYDTAKQMGKYADGIAYKYEDHFYVRIPPFFVRGDTVEEANYFARIMLNDRSSNHDYFTDRILMHNRRQKLALL